MRSRNTKAGFWSNPVLITMPADHRLLFQGLGALCDRRGLVEDRPKKIGGEVLRGIDIDVNAALDALASTIDDDGTTLISRYVGPNGVRVVKINKFLKHNKPHHKEPENPMLCDLDEHARHVVGSLGLAQDMPGASPGLAPYMPSLESLNPESLNPVSCAYAQSDARAPEATPEPEPEPEPEQEPQAGGPGDGDLQPAPQPTTVAEAIADLASGMAMTGVKASSRPPERRRQSAASVPASMPDRGAPPQAEASGNEARTAAVDLAQRIAKLDPACQPTDVALDLWAQHLARLAIRDSRPWPEIAQVMAWAFEASDWWPGRILNAADFARHYAKIRAQWQSESQAADKAASTKADAEVSSETMRMLYETLEFEVNENGDPAAKAWIARQKPNVRPRLSKRLDKLLVDARAAVR